MSKNIFSGGFLIFKSFCISTKVAVLKYYKFKVGLQQILYLSLKKVLIVLFLIT